MSTLTLPLLFVAMSNQHHLPANLLSALCFVESSHNISAVHKDDGGKRDSLGLCQVQYRTAQYMGYKGTAKRLMNPEVNAYYAAKYLAYQIKRYGDINKAIIAYNIGNAKGLVETKYSAKVISTWRAMNVKQRREQASSRNQVRQGKARSVSYSAYCHD